MHAPYVPLSLDPHDGALMAFDGDRPSASGWVAWTMLLTDAFLMQPEHPIA